MPSYRRTKEVLLVPPAIEPVTLADAKLACRVDDASLDGEISVLIATARQTLEAWCWSSFITQTWQYWWDRFEFELFIPRAPLISSTFLQYLAPQATNNVYTTVPTSIYELSWRHGIPFYRIQYLQTWPVTRGYRDDVMCQVVMGYGPNATDVPAPLRHAIKMMVVYLFANHGETPAEMPQAITRLIANYRFKEL